MWQTIELREIRVFLVLAEERHFGRNAERLGIPQSRVSQSWRGLERKLSEQLVHGTSRRVTLTPRGECFRDEAGAAYEQLAAVLRAAHKASRSLTGTLRAGLLNAASGGPHLITIISAFETRHPGCDVEVIELPVRDRFEPLRARGKIVHRTVPSFPSYFGHPNLVSLPITDLPPSKNALVWRRRDSNPRLRGFIDVAREILRTRPDAAHR